MTPHEQALAEATDLYRRTVDSLNRATDTEIMWASIRAYLRARRQIDGAVLCQVPEEAEATGSAGGPVEYGHVTGFNACRTQTLASAEATNA